MLSASSFSSRYQLEINYQFQVLQRGRESVHDSFEIAGTIYRVTHTRGASDELTYYPLSEDVPHDYLEKTYEAKYETKYPEQVAALENYRDVLRSEMVIENMRKLDLFHVFNKSQQEPQDLPEIIKLAPAASLSPVSKEPTTQQVEVIYKQSVILRGHNATHREFYVNNLKLMISTDSTSTELTSSVFNVDFHSEMAVSDSGLSIAQAEAIKTQVEITVNDPTVQEYLRNEPIQNKSVRIKTFLTEKCALMMPIAETESELSASTFTGSQDNWQDEMLSFSSNPRFSDALVLELFKPKPICEALKTELNIKSDNPPLILILMKINALKEKQPILAYELACLIKVYERHDASHSYEEPKINDHIINELTVICESIKPEVEAISLELSKILSREKAIQSAYLVSIKQKGAVQTHHSFVYQHLTIQLIENPNNQDIEVSLESMSTSAAKLSLTEELKEQVQAKIESAINMESIQCQVESNNDFWHKHTEGSLTPLSDEKIQLLVICHQSQEELQASAETHKSENITDRIKLRLAKLPIGTQIECYREFDNSSVCSVERKTVDRQLPLIIWLEIIDALITTNPTRALVIYTSIANKLNPRMVRTLELKALESRIYLEIYNRLDIAEIDSLQKNDPKLALKCLEAAYLSLPEPIRGDSDIHKKIKDTCALLGDKTHEYIEQFKDDSSISQLYVSQIRGSGLLATHECFCIYNLQIKIINHVDGDIVIYKVAQVKVLNSPEVELTDEQRSTLKSKLEKVINSHHVKSKALAASNTYEEKLASLTFLQTLTPQLSYIVSSIRTDRMLSKIIKSATDEKIKKLVLEAIQELTPLAQPRCLEMITSSTNTYNQTEETVLFVVCLLRIKSSFRDHYIRDALWLLHAIKSQLPPDVYSSTSLPDYTEKLEHRLAASWGQFNKKYNRLQPYKVTVEKSTIVDILENKHFVKGDEVVEIHYKDQWKVFNSANYRKFFMVKDSDFEIDSDGNVSNAYLLVDDIREITEENIMLLNENFEVPN